MSNSDEFPKEMLGQSIFPLNHLKDRKVIQLIKQEINLNETLVNKLKILAKKQSTLGKQKEIESQVSFYLRDTVFSFLWECV